MQNVAEPSHKKEGNTTQSTSLQGFPEWSKQFPSWEGVNLFEHTSVQQHQWERPTTRSISEFSQMILYPWMQLVHETKCATTITCNPLNVGKGGDSAFLQSPVTMRGQLHEPNIEGT
jgi:hypothetical protein